MCGLKAWWIGFHFMVTTRWGRNGTMRQKTTPPMDGGLDATRLASNSTYSQQHSARRGNEASEAKFCVGLFWLKRRHSSFIARSVMPFISTTRVRHKWFTTWTTCIRAWLTRKALRPLSLPSRQRWGDVMAGVQKRSPRPSDSAALSRRICCP